MGRPKKGGKQRIPCTKKKPNIKSSNPHTSMMQGKYRINNNSNSNNNKELRSLSIAIDCLIQNEVLCSIWTGERKSIRVMGRYPKGDSTQTCEKGPTLFLIKGETIRSTSPAKDTEHLAGELVDSRQVTRVLYRYYSTVLQMRSDFFVGLLPRRMDTGGC